MFEGKWNPFYLEDWVFQYDYAFEQLTNHFKTNTLQGFGISHLNEGIVAAGVGLHYLAETQHHQLKHITNVQQIANDDYVWLRQVHDSQPRTLQ